MIKKSKLLTTCICLLVMGITVVGTMAWLTDREEVVNTFTVGNVDITVDETDVDTEGKPDGEDRVKENEYHLIPGCEYLKDPTMTVKAGSVESYARMILIVHNASAVQDIIDNYNLGDFSALIDGWDEELWLYQGFTEDTEENSISFEFRYKYVIPATEEDVMLAPLFTTLVVPGEVTAQELQALYEPDGRFKMNVVGHAIQTAGFENEEAAWQAFDKQVEN